MRGYFLGIGLMLAGSAHAQTPLPAIGNGPPAIQQQQPAGGGNFDFQPVDSRAINEGLAQAATPVDNSGSQEDVTRKAAFNAALANTFPFKPDEIHQILEKLDENQHAVAEPPGAMPKAEVKVETISLSPNVEPPEIDMETGFVTTVSFLDATGNPWPILDIGVGGNFDIPAPEAGGNVLRVTPLAKYVVGNLSVRLVNLTTPLSFKLRASTGKVYYRYDARVGRAGPNATAPLIQHGNDLVAGDNTMMDVLGGDPPIDSTRLTVIGTDSRTAAWRTGGKVLLRTPLTLLSPGWDGSVSSSDGIHVFQIPDTPVLLLSDNGNLIHARIGNKAVPDEDPVPAIEDSRAHPAPAAPATSASQVVARANEGVIPTPASSRTLIRPVNNTSQVAQTAANFQPGSQQQYGSQQYGTPQYQNAPAGGTPSNNSQFQPIRPVYPNNPTILPSQSVQQ